MAKKHNNGLESLDQTNPDKWEVPDPLGFDPPKWMIESYDGDDEDMAHDVYAAIFWKMLEHDVNEAKARGKEAPNMNDVAARATEIAKTIMVAAEHTSNISDTAQRAFLTLIYKVKKNNLQHLSVAEYDTIEEWLTDRIEQLSPSAGELSDITYLMGEVFPMLEKIAGGFEPKNLLAIRARWSSTRAAIPYLRFITNRHRDTVRPIEAQIIKDKKRIDKLVFLNKDRPISHPRFKVTAARIEELRDDVVKLEEEHEVVSEEATALWKRGVEKTLKVIADPTVKPWGKEGEKTVKAALFSGEVKELKTYEGYEGVLPGRSIFVLILPSRYERTVEMALGGLVDWKLLDPAVMAKEIEKALENNPFADDSEDDDCR